MRCEEGHNQSKWFGQRSTVYNRWRITIFKSEEAVIEERRTGAPKAVRVGGETGLLRNEGWVTLPPRALCPRSRITLVKWQARKWTVPFSPIYGTVGRVRVPVCDEG